MRRYSLVRGAAVLSVVVVLALDASAALLRRNPREEDPFSRILSILKKTVKTFGDELVTPRP
ncbi:MAG TPA: hypothetical protein VFQ06_06580 [Nitrospira sp.]|nr:hypothetical protein [Nitrospira sp.]